MNRLKNMFSCGVDDAAFGFDEDRWTERLTTSLGLLPHINATQYTKAEASKFTALKEKSIGLSPSVLHCYLFHGAPDIIFENVIVMMLPHEQEVELESQPMDETNNMEVITEISHGKVRSEYPFQKYGELLSNMHIALSDQVLKSLCISQRTTEAFQPFKHVRHSVCGIFLDKLTGPELFRMHWVPDDSDEHKSHLEIQRFHCGCDQLTQHTLCSALKCCGIDLHFIPTV